MKLAVRRVCPIDERHELLGLLQRNLGVSQDGIFDWQYTMNPAGPPWCWFAYVDNSPAAVAMTSLFPRRMYVDGSAVRCGQVTHFVIDTAYRSLGPALQVQKATFEPVDSGELSFCYDCPPHERGMSTFLRLGMRASCEVTRYALPLRSNKYFDKRFGTRAWTKPLAAATNLVLQARTRFRPVPGVEIVEHTGPFGEEFSELDQRVSSSDMIRASRSAVDLQWRYKQDPGAAGARDQKEEYRVLLARRSGELLAFVIIVLNRTEGTGHILDLFGVEIPVVGPSLLEGAVGLCRQTGLDSLYGFCSEGTELESLFRNTGFCPREKIARVVAYENQQKQAGRLLKSALRWPFGQFEVRL
jgi:hypothetical protein